MNLHILQRVYRMYIPLRARRVMVAVANGCHSRKTLHEAMCVRELDPSPSEIDYLTHYLRGRELLTADYQLVRPAARSQRAREFDKGERKTRERESCKTR